MTDQEKDKRIAEAFRKFSRRDMLRTSSLATAGAILMPTFIPRCRKEDFPGHPGGNGGGGVAEPPPINYAAAVANLANLRAWVVDLYPFCIEYENIVFLMLQSTKEANPGWKSFLSDIFIDIAIALAETAAVLSGNPEVVPALACLSAFLHDWGSNTNRPPNLNGTFAAFEIGHNTMQFALEQKLSSLEDPKDNYHNLITQWGDKIDFMGKSYTVSDLATNTFPGIGDDYNQLQQSAYKAFKQRLWNLVIMKCCGYYREDSQYPTTNTTPAGVLLTYMRQEYYPKNKGQYVRAIQYKYVENDYIEWEITPYNLGLNNQPFPDEAANELFIDDTPGNKINPDGLFPRSYVFEQFSLSKPVFEYGHELGIEGVGDLNPAADDWDFTAGEFPYLAKIG